MVDIVNSSTRSRIMAAIKGRNTKPELLIRSLLHKNGFRFRLHVKDLPGKPDIVLPKYRSVIFVHGCFWHGHKNCQFEPYRVCRRVNILRDYPDDKIKIYP